jgi:hypothetical protein
MERFSVICLQCGLRVDRLIDAETAQTEIHPVIYQQKCEIASNAADFDCLELARAVKRSRRWDPIFRSGMFRPKPSDVVNLLGHNGSAPAKEQKGTVKSRKRIIHGA